ncbi:hypothetical protein KJ819_03395 [Patescibacteria group bacterium]|nr:hypothetical protein [Patescibacteria group bacterium]MBU1500515.1 hypothetical protein [Patescibacteria group bacterium]MBU2080686.1 hypothetical protein [Patescibacteria group bacterium]MBU2123791.1 hypothetical protein [Patescibacteria group bacterium]MBU2194918.1 hypothetical protein [Patescibacteria group bacterium]
MLKLRNIAVVFTLVLALSIPNAASAQSISSLQAQIQVLLAQLALLQAQLQARNADLVLHESAENPDAATLEVSETQVSEDYTVFVFELENTTDEDIEVSELVLDTETLGTLKTSALVDSATLSFDGDYYNGVIERKEDGSIVFRNMDAEIKAEDTETFELEVAFAASKSAYELGTTIEFSLSGEGVSAVNLETGGKPRVAGTAVSAEHILSLEGVWIEAVSASQSVTTLSPVSNSYGTYTIKFDVSAGNSDIVIPGTANTSPKAGVVYRIAGSPTFNGTSSAVLTSTGDKLGGAYVVQEGDTETFTLTVTLDPTTSAAYGVHIDGVYRLAAGIQTYQYIPAPYDNGDFQTDQIWIPDTGDTTLKPTGSFDVAPGSAGVEVTTTAPRITGLASNTSTVALTITDKNGQRMFRDTQIKVVNGRWAVTVSPDLPRKTEVYSLMLTSGVGTVPIAVTALRVTIDDTTATDTYRGYMNGRLFIETKNITEAAALENCKLNATNNPGTGIYCTWGKKEIYRRDIDLGPKPTISFTASPSQIVSGGATTLSWSTKNATQCSLMSTTNEYYIGVNGSMTLTPSSTMVYRLNCVNGSQTGKEDAPRSEKRIAVLVSSPTASGSIDSSSLYAYSGNPTISGTATNANTVGISIANGDKVYGSGDVTVKNGRWSVTVSPSLSPGKYSVTLSANNATLATGSLIIEDTTGPLINPGPTNTKTIAPEVLGASAIVGADAALASLAAQLKVLVDKWSTLKP